jgi:hypothetical protein
MIYSMSSSQKTLDREPGAASDKISPTSHHQAAHAVLFTNELLCDIVARLPVQDIVVATGICKFWRTALSGNERIQTAMFLKPAEIQEAMVQDYLAYCLTRPIPLDRCFVIGEVHPSLAKICGSVAVGEDNLFRQESQPFPQFPHHNGTWRDMFISQPPCKRLTVTIDELKGPYRHLENSAGIKLGELYDHIHTNLASEVVENLGVVTLGEFAAVKDVQTWETFTVKCRVRHGVVSHPEGAPSRPVINPFTGIEGDFSRPGDFVYSDESDSDASLSDDLADATHDDHHNLNNDDEDFQDE